MGGKKLIITLFVLNVLFIFLTIALYLYKFGSWNFSSKSDDWVDFSNYFSGILNPILTSLNLIIFAYLSFKLIKIEDDRNNWTLQELARPYANIEYENTYESIEIIIHNVGLGPMILKDFKIISNTQKVYKNFYDLINKLADEEDPNHNFHPKIDSFEIGEGTGAIARDKSQCIFKLYFIEKNENNKNFIDAMRKKLNNYNILATYNDIYGRQIECMNEKIHFATWV